jgi:hypothetical protein
MLLFKKDAGGTPAPQVGCCNICSPLLEKQDRNALIGQSELDRMLIHLNWTLRMDVCSPMIPRGEFDRPGLVVYPVIDNNEQIAPGAINQPGSKCVATNRRRNDPREDSSY